MRTETTIETQRRSYKTPALKSALLLEEERCICASTGDLPGVPEEDSGIDTWEI